MKNIPKYQTDRKLSCVEYRKGSCKLLLLIALLINDQVSADTVSVNNSPGLIAAINNPANTQINFTGDITLANDLPTITRNIVINGDNHVLNGSDAHRGFVVFGQNQLDINNLTISRTLALGKNGGDSTPNASALLNLGLGGKVGEGSNNPSGVSESNDYLSGGGGGGAGMGGGLFVHQNSTVNLSNVSFDTTAAKGGNAGFPVSGGPNIARLVANFAIANAGSISSSDVGGGGKGGVNCTKKVPNPNYNPNPDPNNPGFGNSEFIYVLYDCPKISFEGRNGSFGGGKGGSGGRLDSGGQPVKATNGSGGSAMGGAVFVMTGGKLNIKGSGTWSTGKVTGGTGDDANGKGYGGSLFIGSTENGAPSSTTFVKFSPEAGQTLTINDDISDGLTDFTSNKGGIEKNGEGTLILNGENSFFGGTILNQGILSISSAKNLGNGFSSITFNGGILRITGNSFFGTSLFSHSSIFGSKGGGYDIDSPTNVFTVQDNLTGEGSLRKLGAGTLVLKGTNSYTGGTTVEGGVLQGDTGSLQGNITNNAAVVFDQDSFGTYAGQMSGNGTLIKQNTGTLALTGKNTYSGGTIVNAGVLQGNTDSLQGDITNNAEVIFDQTTTDTYRGNMSGSGTLSKEGASTLNLTGNNTFSGGINLNFGTLSARSDNNLGTGSLNFNSGILQITGTSFKSTPRVINWSDQGGGFDIADAGNVFTVSQILGRGLGISCVERDCEPPGLTKLGAGTLVLAGNNTYIDGTNLNIGTISVSSNNNLGDPAGALNFNGGILQITGNNFKSTSRTINWGANGGGFDIADANNIFSLTQILSGQGGLTKLGNGKLILSGNNTYAGGTTVSGGVLQGNTDSLQGNIANNANITFDQSIDGIFNGVISGSGSLTKQNNGTLTLTGTHSYSGGNNLNAGTVSVNSDSNLGAAAGALNFNGGILQITGTNFKSTPRPITLGTQGGSFNITDDNNIFSLTQILSGQGGLTKLGNGKLVLFGKNTYTGSTTVSGGVLQGNTKSLQGDIANNANITFDQAIDGIFNGVITGNGSLTKQNNATLTLTGTHSYSGGTNLNAGTVSVNSDSNLGTAAGALNFNGGILQITGNSFKSTSRTINWGANGGGFDIANSGNIFKLNQDIGVESTGGLLKRGAGTLVLNGNNAYTGSTTVNAGNLQIGDDTHLGSSINSPVTVDPTGTLSGHGIINGDVFNSGTLSPGGSIGTLNVTGNVVFTPTSLFNVEIDPNQASLLNVGRTASLGNAGVNIVVDPGTYIPRTYTILNTNNGVSGQFATLATSAPILSAAREFLTPSLEYSPNQVNLRLTGLVDPLGPTRPDTPKIIPQIFTGRLNDPLGIRCAENRYGFWARGLGMFSSTDAIGSTPGFTSDTGGAVMGFDHQFGEHLALGIAAFTTHTDVITQQAVNTRSSSDDVGAALYASMNFGPWQFKTALSYDNNTYSGQRLIATGAGQISKQSKTHANQLSNYDELSYSFKYGGLTLQPTLGLSMGWLRQNGFSEKGGNVAENLSVDGRTMYSLNTLVGLRARKTWDLNNTLKAQVELRAFYDHDFGTLQNFRTARVNGTTGLIRTADRPDQRDAGILGASINLLTTNSLNFYLDYNGEIRSGQSTHFVNAGIRYVW